MVILTTWLVWVVLVILCAIVAEFIRDRLEHEVSLSSYSKDELHKMYDFGRSLSVKDSTQLSSSENRGEKQ